MPSALLASLEEWEYVYAYISEYGVHIALWAFLSAVTIYRREMSVNRLYHHDDEEEDSATDLPDEDTLSSPASLSSQMQRILVMRDEHQELETEELLEGAGLYCSAVKPMLNLASVASLWLDCFPGDDEEPSLKMMESDMTPSDLLERAGNYASGEPIAAAMALFNLAKRIKAREDGQMLLPLCVAAGSDPFMKELPPDVHVHILSFLHPRDVVKLPSVSKKYRNIIDDSTNITCARIWKNLWQRDYAWIVEEWNIGRRAFQRSNCTQWSYDKEFYFRFGQSYLNYVLAGMNTHETCLVGIHSNIYDITPFLLSHPGSPDTLMVHAGRDATAFFEDMGHSMGARRLAMSLCVVIDKSAQNENGCGLFPTTHTVVNHDSRIPGRLPDGSDNLLLLGRHQARTNRTGTLHRVRRELNEEKERIWNRVTQQHANDPSILGHEVNPYFDPFLGQWQIWYTDTDLQTVFMPS